MFPGGNAASTSSCVRPVDLEILFATTSFFSLPGIILIYFSNIFEIVSTVPHIGNGIPLMTPIPIPNSRGKSLCHVLLPLTTKLPLPSDYPLSVFFET